MRDAEQRSHDKHEAMKKLSDCLAALDTLEDHLDNVGFTRLSERVYNITAKMSIAMEELDKIDGEDAQAMMQGASESSYAMLKACLAGVTLGKEEAAK